MARRASHTFFWKLVPLMSRSRENALRLPAKYSESWGSVWRRMGCLSFATNSLRRTRWGLSFSQRMATRPLSLATNFNFPTGESIVLKARLIACPFGVVDAVLGGLEEWLDQGAMCGLLVVADASAAHRCWAA